MPQPSIDVRHPVVKKVADVIVRYAMLESGDRVLAAVSGGADSTALLHILNALAPTFAIQVAVAHLNHGLRGRDADNDAEFVRTAAEGLGLTCHLATTRLDPSRGSLEERGRRERYAFYRRLSEKEGYTKIALGHHMDDNAEAVLMHLLRGSGLRGLSGIPPIRNPSIIRPLIDLSRDEIVRFLRQHGIPFVKDETNADPRFERNRIRHQLIPLLKKQYNANVVAALHRTADLCWQEERWLQTSLKPLLEEAVTSVAAECMTLRIDGLAKAPLALQRRLLRDALRQWQGHLKRINAPHVDSLIQLLSPGSTGKRICLPNRIGVLRTATGLRFTLRHGRGFPEEIDPPAYRHEVPGPVSAPLALEIPEAGCRLRFTCDEYAGSGDERPMEKSIARLDMAHLNFPLRIRNFRPGDRMQPAGMQGSRKITKILADQKIPVADRSRVPLLISGDDILWVAGIRRSAKAAVSRRTRTVLTVQVFNPPGS